MIRLTVCLLTFLNVTSAMGQYSAQPAPPEDVIIAPRLFGEIKRDVRAGLREEATAELESTDWHAALARLTGLYQEIIAHPRLTRKSDLHRTRRVLRSRLLKAHKKLRPEDKKAEAGDPQKVAQVGVLEPQREVLAQQRGFAAGGQVGGFGAGGGGQPAGAAGQGDYGDQLAELIERVVSADIWESAGGPAAIVYHRPSMAMVISAPEDVHDEIRELLTNLRAAGP